MLCFPFPGSDVRDYLTEITNFQPFPGDDGFREFRGVYDELLGDLALQKNRGVLQRCIRSTILTVARTAEDAFSGGLDRTIIQRLQRDFSLQHHGATGPPEVIRLVTKLENHPTTDGSTPRSASDSTISAQDPMTFTQSSNCPPSGSSVSARSSQIMVIEGDLICIENCGMDLWVNSSTLTVRFGNGVGSSELEFLRRLHLSNFAVRRMDSECFSIEIVPTSPGPEVAQRSTYIVQNAVCISQPGAHLQASKNGGNIRFGNLGTAPDAAEKVIQPRGNTQDTVCPSSGPVSLVRTPDISLDVRLDNEQIEIEWELL
ncbi:hypothetical protein B0H16DRAFT_1531238 [Mycena metata]|uniref:Uncharacterized protein n=1 Tax=Mycena metata TaxID=1033252 RepID=A0AAD7JDD2_9AGAR|nr:hypothetical protein B0H16DRAFT_1531238 [Mycena metata]